MKMKIIAILLLTSFVLISCGQKEQNFDSLPIEQQKEIQAEIQADLQKGLETIDMSDFSSEEDFKNSEKVEKLKAAMDTQTKKAMDTAKQKYSNIDLSEVEKRVEANIDKNLEERQGK